MNRQSVMLIFSKKAQKKTGVKKALLEFDKNRKFSHLKLIDIDYTDKRQVKLELKQTKEKLNFKKNYFIFKVPKNSEVTYQ